MKHLLIALAVVALSFVAFGKVTQAQSCTITNTGPGSTNICETINDFTCQLTNENSFVVLNNNTQESTTGYTTNGSSGTATNNNGTVITVTINDGGCQIASVTPVTPTPTPTPTVAPTPTPTIKVLANTGNNPTATLTEIVAGLGAVAVLSTFSVAAYRRFK